MILQKKIHFKNLKYKNIARQEYTIHAIKIKGHISQNADSIIQKKTAITLFMFTLIPLIPVVERISLAGISLFYNVSLR